MKHLCNIYNKILCNFDITGAPSNFWKKAADILSPSQKSAGKCEMIRFCQKSHPLKIMYTLENIMNYHTLTWKIII